MNKKTEKTSYKNKKVRLAKFRRWQVCFQQFIHVMGIIALFE